MPLASRGVIYYCTIERRVETHPGLTRAGPKAGSSDHLLAGRGPVQRPFPSRRKGRKPEPSRREICRPSRFRVNLRGDGPGNQERVQRGDDHC